jgi:hypothetical protein
MACPGVGVLPVEQGKPNSCWSRWGPNKGSSPVGWTHPQAFCSNMAGSRQGAAVID